MSPRRQMTVQRGIMSLFLGLHAPCPHSTLQLNKAGVGARWAEVIRPALFIVYNLIINDSVPLLNAMSSWVR